MDIKIAPSARTEVDMIEKVEEIIETSFYFKDYMNLTMKLCSDNIEYKKVIQCYSKVMRELF